MKLSYIIAVGLLLTMGTTSCRKYVEVEQYNRRELKYTADYQYLLNDFSLFGQAFSIPVISSDDVVITREARQNTTADDVLWPYTWADQYFADGLKDATWDDLYRQIYTANTIIEGVMDSENGSDQEKKRILAEAKVQRAYAYFILVNLYGQIYNSSTASSAIGVPLLTTPDLYVSLDRASLETVYGQIVKDLTEAGTELPRVASNNRHPHTGSAHAVLAMVYLQMREFDKAFEQADKALSYHDQLFDLRELALGNLTLPFLIDNPETFLSKKNKRVYMEQLNPGTLSKFATNDLRFTELIQNLQFQQNVPADAQGLVKWYNGDGVEVGPTVADMLLIKAEVYARNGDAQKSMDEVNILRKKRFLVEDYIDLTATSADNALDLVIEERQREFIGTGKRWFDMRRFNLDSRLAKAYRRTFRNVEYTLDVNSNKFVYPVADYYLNFNPEIGQIPR